MAFFKKHYEKILLSIVLLGLTAALGFIPVRLNAVKTELDALEQSIKDGEKKPYKLTDLTKQSNYLARLQEATPLDFSGNHNLVGPVQWVRRGGVGGDLKKVETGNEAGLGALIVKGITPLQFIVTYKGSSSGSYNFEILREEVPAQEQASNKKPATASVAKVGDVMNSKKWIGSPAIVLKLKEIQGAADAPAGFVFSRSDKPDDTLTVTPAVPFKEVKGYEVDMTYPLEGTELRKLRKGSVFVTSGETNKVVDIRETEVVVSDPAKKEITLKKLP